MMNLIKTLFLVLMIGMITGVVFAQDKRKTETAEFKVEGICGMCKERIENASLLKGVKFTEWNLDTHLLKVIYRPDKVSLDDIHKSIAKAGHGTEKVNADMDAYEKLPICCHYMDKDNPHNHQGHQH